MRRHIPGALLLLGASVTLAAVITPMLHPPEGQGVDGGSLFDDLYFTGPLDVSARFDDPRMGLGSTGELSLDACADGVCPVGDACSTSGVWLPAEVKPGLSDPTSLSAGGDAAYPSIAALVGDTPRWAITWQRSTRAGWEAWYAIVGEDGLPVRGASPVAPGHGDQRHPAATALPDGGFAITWTEQAQQDVDVILQVFDASGAARALPAPVSESSGDQQLDPSITTDAAGNLLVTWTTGWDPTTARAISDPQADAWVAGRWFTSAGSSLGPSLRVPDVAAYRTLGAASTSLAGQALVVWRGHEPVGEPMPTRELVVRPLGAPSSRGAPSLVSSAALQDARDLVAAAAPDGDHLAIAWDHEHGSGRSVAFQLLDSALIPLLPAPTAPTDSAGREQLRPALAFLDDQQLLIAWSAVDDAGAGTIAAALFDTTTGAQGGDAIDLREGMGPATAATPALSRHGSGRILLAWAERPNGGDGQLMVRELRPEGEVVARRIPHGDHDVDVQARWTDTEGTTRCSQVVRWRWANPAAASEGEAVYADGPTRALQLEVSAELSPGPQDQLLSLELQQRTGTLRDGACDAWSGWETVRTQEIPSLTPVDLIDLPTAACVQAQWLVTNRARVVWPHSSDHIALSDRVPPVIDAWALEVDGPVVQVTLGSHDEHVGLAEASATAGAGAAQAVVPNGTTPATLTQDGPQAVDLVVLDRAGNDDRRTDYIVADLGLPHLDVLSPAEGRTYGEDVPLVYTVTGDVIDLDLSLDGAAWPLTDLLGGITDGPHTLTLSGLGPDGETITDSSTFVVVRGAPTAVITAPRPGLYEDDHVVATWYVSDPAAIVTLQLDDGIWTRDPAFTGVQDGGHVLRLSASTATGTATDEVHFDVVDGVPLLELTSPAPDEVVATGTPQVLCVTSATEVRWTVDGRSGTMSCGERIPNTGQPLPDGRHELLLQVAHATSGATVHRAVSFVVDTRAPGVSITNPTASLYTTGDIPLTWEESGPRGEVTFTLDGTPVNALVGVTPGAHELTATRVDAAGQQVSDQVRFVVTDLRLVSPQPGDQVATTRLPPEVPIRYEGGAGCDSVSLAIDTGAASLVQAGPGEELRLPVTRGAHTLRLSCQAGAERATTLVDFEIGENNLTAGPGALQYTFDGCDDAWTCDVTVSAIVRNTGDFDLPAGVAVRLDHLHNDGTVGSDSQRALLPALAQGSKTTATFTPVRARMEDRLSILLDPDEAVPGERREDNYAEVPFQAGGMHAVESVLDGDGHVLSGASLTDGMLVTTSGAISRVEARTPGLTVVDDHPAGGSWQALTDLGHLSPEQDCVELVAVGANGVTLDAMAVCPEVSRTDLAPEGYAFPWYRHAEGGVVRMAALERGAMAGEATEAFTSTMAHTQRPLLPVLQEDGSVAYALHLLAGFPDGPLQKDLGDAPLVGGNWTVPTQTALYTFLVNPTQGTCSAEGVVLTGDQGLIGTFEQAAEDAFDVLVQDQINNLDIGELIENLAPGPTVVGDLPWGSHNFLFAGAVDLPAILGIEGLGIYTLGFLDLSLTEPTVTIELVDDEGVNAVFDVDALCSVLLSGPSGLMQLASDPVHLGATVKTRLELHIGPQHADAFGVFLPSWNWIPVPALFGVYVAEAELHPQEVIAPGVTTFDITARLVRGFPPVEASASARSQLSTDVPKTPLMDASFTAYPLIASGFGIGQDFRTEWQMNAWGNVGAEASLDFIAGSMQNPAGAGGYSRFALETETRHRMRYCILWGCWWGSWSGPDVSRSCQDFGDDASPVVPDDLCPCVESPPPWADCLGTPAAIPPFVPLGGTP